MRIHEIILESTDKNELLDFIKQMTRAEKDAVEFLDDHGAEELDEDFKSKLKKAAAIGALGLAGLGAGGAADAQQFSSTPFNYGGGQSEDIMLVLARCSADMVTMSKFAAASGDQQKAAYYASMADKGKSLAIEHTRGAKNKFDFTAKVYKDRLDRNLKYSDPRETTQDGINQLKRSISSSIEKCADVINTNKLPQPKTQPQPQPASKLSPEQLRAQFAADAKNTQPNIDHKEEIRKMKEQHAELQRRIDAAQQAAKQNQK